MQIIHVLIQVRGVIMTASIQKTTAVPLYQQLKNKIKKDIRTGILKPGDKLPSEAQMQAEYGLSRVTVRNAMADLEGEGYIIKVQGKGSFVSESDMLRLPVGVTSFSEDARLQGVELTSKVISAELCDPVTEMDSEFFGLDDGEKIMIIRRVRYADGVPVIIEENHLPGSLESIKEEDLTGSLYEILMKNYNMIPVNKGRRSVKIIFADREIAELLELSQGTPVIESEMCVFDISGEPVHIVKDIVRGDNDRFLKWYV